MLADDEHGTVQDHHEASDRQVEALPIAEEIARIAVARTLAARGARSVAGQRLAVLFEPQAAATLILELVGALSGARQAGSQTFLPDPLGSIVAARHLDIVEDPYEPWGLASSPFDNEGVAGTCRAILASGEARGLFLGAHSARRLGMRSTGNASGCYNLRVSSTQAGDRAAMLRQLGTGLIVSKLLGGATDPVRGSWTRAVAGHWVDHGEVVHPVRDVTLAGDLPAMLRDITAVGTDIERMGAIRTGSILVKGMQMGSAT